MRREDQTGRKDNVTANTLVAYNAGLAFCAPALLVAFSARFLGFEASNGVFGFAFLAGLAGLAFLAWLENKSQKRREEQARTLRNARAAERKKAEIEMLFGHQAE